MDIYQLEFSGCGLGLMNERDVERSKGHKKVRV
jgi:hypothetical protein